MNYYRNIPVVVLALTIGACTSPSQQKDDEVKKVSYAIDNRVEIEAESFLDASVPTQDISNKSGYVTIPENGWLSYDVMIESAGRYKIEGVVKASEGTLWLEDYVDNKDGRTYNVTGSMSAGKNGSNFTIIGTPFNRGLHKMRLHAGETAIEVDKLTITLIKDLVPTPNTHTQSMNGENWELVWSDEFNGDEVDTTKWTYDIGDWGWGNNELQFYTKDRKENARLEDGNLIIEARKGDMGHRWTSARLTTREKHSFLYGKIEFRAQVPAGKGNWAAGWTLGDDYVDELSWPYCGEIDIMESVGYEVNDETGDGIAHVTVHTPAYYFKINNQISNTKEIKNISGEFHTYGVEWTPTEVRGYVDGEHYYTYDKNADEKEWPFNSPQNIILNLAMGGGWGGAQGMDPSISSQQLIIDYVRVYQSN